MLFGFSEHDFPPDFPYRSIALLLLTVLPEVLIHSMLGPTYPYMVRHLLPNEDRIGYYAGLLQSAYFLPTIVCAPVMGFLSDKYGRKPVLLAGLAGYGCGTMLLGLSPNYWMSVASLFVTGCFAGNTVVAKGMIGELAKDDRSRALAYSAYGIVYGICGVTGAVMGGYLADPLLFVGIPVLEQLPYLVACSVGSFTALISGLVVQFSFSHTSNKGAESSPRRDKSKKGVKNFVYNQISTALDSDNSLLPDDLRSYGRSFDEAGKANQRFEMTQTKRRSSTAGSAFPSDRTSHDNNEDIDSVSDTDSFDNSAINHTLENKSEFYVKHIAPYLNLMTSRTLVPLSMYTLFALSNAIFFTALSLIAAAPIDRGGYNLSQRVSFWSMAGYAFMKIVVKAGYFKANSILGTRWTYRLGVGVMLPAVLLIPGRFGLDWKEYAQSLISSNNATTVADTAALILSNSNTTETTQTARDLITVLFRRSFSAISSKGANHIGYSAPITALVLCTTVMGFGDALTYLSVVMLITDSVPDTQYGLIHGLGGCLASIVRTIGPTLGGVLWETGGANWVVFSCVAFIIVTEFSVSFLK
ncbi:hypothetical protein CcCBS67573_g02678 [Chytriomyces confervae]|uniref:Major facilitator superfamily (MFS) profile domain-containing protein n=1 Tax=Chytriomyces confervae TaxID=246404 RepID=A0A507FKU8_9FUNG|nr:hypothetical protein CcCBS67573_g02678 [Chytriomyces confervae]